MTILSAQSIHELAYLQGDNNMICPYTYEFPQPKSYGMSYGLSGAGYDIRVGKIHIPNNQQATFNYAGGETVTELSKQGHWFMLPPGGFVLMSSLERLKIPNDILVIVHDKSTLARQGLALQNTVLEPGWEGWITLELSNHGDRIQQIHIGQPIAQLVFHKLDQPTDRPYTGKYQNQEDKPVPAKFAF